MAFRLVSSGSSVKDPTVVNMPASGTVWPGGVVIRDVSANRVSAATATGATTTNIVGVCLDYRQGASDVEVRVTLFEPGQIWEADCVNAVATTNVLIRHTLADSLVLRNITNTYETASTAVFDALAITGATTGSGRLLGRFVQLTPTRTGNYDILG